MATALDAPQDMLDADECEFVGMIREHGWYDTRIFAEDNSPAFNFTTGFQITLSAPEIIIFGFPQEVAHAILWSIFRDIKAGLQLETGRLYENFANLPVMFQPVAVRNYADHLGWSRWFYGNDNFSCWQLIWPDKESRFPWQAGFDSKYVGLQTDLSDGGWGRL